MNSSLFYINGTAVPLTTSWSTGKLTIVDILKNLIILPVDIAKTATNIQSASQLYLSHVLSGNYWAIAYGFVIICLIYSTIALILPSPPQQNNTKKEVEEEEEPVVLRDFTLEQLRAFNGENGKPIYISLKHEVFDVSTAPEYYGKGQGYHCFAGREASRAMAKLSFEESELSRQDYTDLSAFERDILEDWYNKFKLFRCYPIVGRLSVPPTGLRLNKDQLKEFKGTQEVPNGRIDAPIYISLCRKILDVSYGGKEMYGPGGGYHLFTGIDCSKALAKMSFEPALWGDLNFDDLTPQEKTVMDDWMTKLSAKYPQVGELID